MIPGLEEASDDDLEPGEVRSVPAELSQVPVSKRKSLAGEGPGSRKRLAR